MIRFAIVLALAAALFSIPSVAATSSANAPRAFGVSALLGVPHPLNLSGEWRINPRASIALSAGGLSVPYTSGTTQYKFGIKNADLRGRWHPFSGAFFLGTAFGMQWLSGSATDSFDTGTGVIVPTKAEVSIQALYLTPHLGWIWSFKTGFMFGFEFGWQVPLNPSTTMDISSTNPALSNLIEVVKQTSAYTKMESNLRDTGDKVGKISFPYVTVLRIGWSF